MFLQQNQAVGGVSTKIQNGVPALGTWMGQGCESRLHGQKLGAYAASFE